MKIAKTVKSRLVLSLMAVLIVMTIACKKDKAQPATPKPALQGDWQELSLSAGLERNISFRSDKSFRMDMVSRIGTSYTVSTYTGTYTLADDKVEVKLTEERTTKDNVPVSSAAINTILYEKGTYKVENNTLTLKYITYPADAPVNTEATFRRRLID